MQCFCFFADIFLSGKVCFRTRCKIVGADHISDCCSCHNILHLCCQKVDGSLLPSLGNIHHGCRCCIHSLCEFSFQFTQLICVKEFYVLPENLLCYVERNSLCLCIYMCVCLSWCMYTGVYMQYLSVLHCNGVWYVVISTVGMQWE